MKNNNHEWTRRVPKRPGWYWRVEPGGHPVPIAIERSESPDRDPIICGDGPGLDCESLDHYEEAEDGPRWSKCQIKVPARPKWDASAADVDGD